MIYSQLIKDDFSIKILEKKATIASNKYLNFIKMNPLVLLISKKKQIDSNQFEVSYSIYRNGKEVVVNTAICSNQTSFNKMVLEHC